MRLITLAAGPQTGYATRGKTPVCLQLEEDGQGGHFLRDTPGEAERPQLL
jgi:hypothetical protein